MAPECPDFDILEQLIVGDLTGEARDEISRHTDLCPECQERISSVRDNLSAVGSLRRVMNRAGHEGGEPQPAPSEVGPYRIIEEIGRGGMGVVYRAEQSNPRRHVALKILHPGFGADDRFERMFQREADVLARLEHAAIAVVHEAGKSRDGRSYLVMELVDGRPLGEHAKARGLSIQSRLALFLKVCRAVAYAHQRGVIHRDLKPSNILVTADGSPKVLDFGLAKILEPGEGATGATLIGEEGRIQGTLPYMSPEQVQGRSSSIDVRSDVYSLGVILHELLSGDLPYPIDRRNLAQSARTIVESPPARLPESSGPVRIEVEAIIRMAMEKEPDRRYSSASALADDIERLLAGQPVSARPATIAYQLRKLVRRHKAASIAMGLAMVLLAGSSVMMSFLYAQARENLIRAGKAEKEAAAEAERARHEAEVANQIRDFLVGIFRVSDPELGTGAGVTAGELLAVAAKRIESTVTGNRQMNAELTSVIGDVYVGMGMYEEGAVLLRRAYAEWQAVDPDSLGMATTASSLATVDRMLGHLEDAEKEYGVALPIMLRNRKGEDLHVMSILRSRAEIQAELGNAAAAEQTMFNLIELMRRDPKQRYALPGTLNGLAGMMADREAYAEALPLMSEAVDAARELGPLYRGQVVDKLEGNSAWLMANAGKLDEAERTALRVLRARREKLPAGHPELTTPLVTLGMVELKRGRPAEAEAYLREAVEIREARLAPGHPDIAEVRGLLGRSLGMAGRHDEAYAMLRSAYEAFRPEPVRNAIPLTHVAESLAECCRSLGRTDEARRWVSASKGEWDAALAGDATAPESSRQESRSSQIPPQPTSLPSDRPASGR